ncbi:MULTISPECIES: Mov34/MPN/PAD-1 family protein [Hyphomicrobiales]|uniref:Mov34/MPN/PAD-1 family protein n=1 Tax=Hyphomicrobiales TaxID=356 RepID=UPI00048CF0DE|nr:MULTISPECIES: Mov34/MPN/PAD-1 family protein [Hyphomicrobiales]CAH1655220.1 Mov34/MPN/PAD-1 family protein [Hyphomicrobiales bacterium]MBS7740349.1 Mov34/MPN/PAD-1 family protein [Chelatococcus sp. HY11]MBX3547174.1 Mov34/MPN/PAD-1 family protein [Chelatococcus sp.]MCO5078408.1 Mov34/MPN/PAD-1 family protein [Chelatococcus sp.]MCX5518520.1 Mov34/MPN/PAD-1 family protein [Kaistia defluvii]
MQIALPSSVRKKICKELSLSGRRETGGLLLAEQLDDEGRFRVVDVTVDPRGGESAYFERRPELHAQALEAFFEKNGNDFSRFNYLGEWHSHPRFPVSPSTTDIRTMQAMVEDAGNIDFSVLMIVRLRMFVMLQVGTYLFMRGQSPQRVEMIDDPVSRPKRRFI